MMRDTSPLAAAAPAQRRRRMGLWLFVLALPAGGCSLVEDEFTWLDRAAPSTVRAPDAPPSGVDAGH